MYSRIQEQTYQLRQKKYVLEYLDQHVDNILPSHISPRTVNGLSMIPLRKVAVTIKLGKQTYQDDLDIYPGVSGALISWKAAKNLDILPASYPHPDNSQCMGTQMSQESCSNRYVKKIDSNPTAEDLVK